MMMGIVPDLEAVVTPGSLGLHQEVCRGAGPDPGADLDPGVGQGVHPDTGPGPEGVLLQDHHLIIQDLVTPQLLRFLTPRSSSAPFTV